MAERIASSAAGSAGTSSSVAANLAEATRSLWRQLIVDDPNTALLAANDVASMLRDVGDVAGGVEEIRAFIDAIEPSGGLPRHYQRLAQTAGSLISAAEPDLKTAAQETMDRLLKYRDERT